MSLVRWIDLWRLVSVYIKIVDIAWHRQSGPLQLSLSREEACRQNSDDGLLVKLTSFSFLILRFHKFYEKRSE